jgi:glyoxylase-like metal-dependent hydrolase (beta-lactamase superfamily II)
MSIKVEHPVSLEPRGLHALPDLYVVSWLSMTPDQLDCHVYVLRGADGLVLIDCGTPWGHARILQNMSHWGLDVGQVRTILFTHGHVDHVRGGYLFKRRGVEILAHPAAATEAERHWNECLKAEGSSERWRVDGHLNEGDRVSRCGFDFQVFHTPGHTAGCLSFLTTINNAACLFSGDLVMSDANPGWRGDPAHDESAIRANIARLRKFKFTHLCHGHDCLLNDNGRLFETALQRADRGEWDLAKIGSHHAGTGQVV